MKELELIQLYYYLCQFYDKELGWYCQRFSPNSSPGNQKITDEELLTIYFYCRRFENKHRKKDIHDFALRFMSGWFPNLPTYANFNTRLNFLESAVLAFIPMLLQTIENQDIVKNIQTHIALVDSLPIMLCSGKRKGKVAPELNAKSSCATWGVYYYRVKLHALAFKVPKRLLWLHFLSLTPASENDLTAILTLLNPSQPQIFLKTEQKMHNATINAAFETINAAAFKKTPYFYAHKTTWFTYVTTVCLIT